MKTNRIPTANILVFVVGGARAMKTNAVTWQALLNPSHPTSGGFLPLKPSQASSCGIGQSWKRGQTFTSLDRLILRGEKQNLCIVSRYRQVS